MEILIQLVLLAVGFVLLVKGADCFVDGASQVAARLRIPQLIIGLTIVAMGTSAPEAAVSISAALKGSADITIGNIAGSNILNILIILGLSALLTPLPVERGTTRREMPFLAIISLLLLVQGLMSRGQPVGGFLPHGDQHPRRDLIVPVRGLRQLAGHIQGLVQRGVDPLQLYMGV